MEQPFQLMPLDDLVNTYERDINRQADRTRQARAGAPHSERRPPAPACIQSCPPFRQRFSRVWRPQPPRQDAGSVQILICPEPRAVCRIHNEQLLIREATKESRTALSKLEPADSKLLVAALSLAAVVDPVDHCVVDMGEEATA